MFKALLAVLLIAPFTLPAEPLKLHPVNPHYFLFRGKPIIIVSSAEHYGAVLNLDFDYLKYLDTMAAGGMNYVRIFTGSYREVPGDFGIERNTLAPAPGRFLAPWPEHAGKFDLSADNPAYHKRLRDFVAAASERGLIVEVTLFCSTYGAKQWSVSPFNPANRAGDAPALNWKDLHTANNGGVIEVQHRLVQRIVRELNSFDNVIYEIQNEPWADRTVPVATIHPYAPARWPNSVDAADEASLRWQQQVAAWIQLEESSLPNRHLIAWNVCNFRHTLAKALPGASIVNFHYAFPEAALWNQHLNLPLAYDETGFLGGADATYRREAWRFLLAGGGAFNHLDYSFSAGREDGTDSQPKSPGGGSPALRKQFGVLSRFLHELPFIRMKPDPAFVESAPGLEVQALSSPGEAYAAYFNGQGPVEVSVRLPAGPYRVEWISTLDGQLLTTTTLTHRGGSARLNTPAFAPDIALRIRR